MKIRLWAILFVTVIIPVHLVYGAPSSDPVQAFNFSETVLTGKILSVEILSKTISSPYPCETECSANGFALYEIQVEEYLKNPSDAKRIKVLGNYSINSGRGENPPFEVGQTVLLYIQKENRIPGYDVVIRTGDSRVLDGPVCAIGSTYNNGLCEPEHTDYPNPKSHPNIPIPSCVKGKVPANNYAWNSQDCLWEWSPGRNENVSGPAPSIIADPCGTEAILVDGICRMKSPAPINCVGYVFGFALNECLLTWYIVLAVVVSIIVGAIFVIRGKRK